jgi:hypothetical protein
LHDTDRGDEVTQRHNDERNGQVEALETRAESEHGQRRRQHEHDAHEEQRGWLDCVEQQAVEYASCRRQGGECARGADQRAIVAQVRADVFGFELGAERAAALAALQLRRVKRVWKVGQIGSGRRRHVPEDTGDSRAPM